MVHCTNIYMFVIFFVKYINLYEVPIFLAQLSVLEQGSEKIFLYTKIFEGQQITQKYLLK